MKINFNNKYSLSRTTPVIAVILLLAALTYSLASCQGQQKPPIVNEEGEPDEVITPPSVVEEETAESNLISIFVSPEGKVYLEVLGSKNATDHKSTEELRKLMLLKMGADYNIKFTDTEIETFSKLNAFGVPMSKMKEWLNMEPKQRDKFLKAQGIPIDTNENPNNLNQFQKWVMAAYNSGIGEAINSGEGIAIKADQTTPYSIVHMVMDNLQTINMNKFKLLTALNSEEE